MSRLLLTGLWKPLNVLFMHSAAVHTLVCFFKEMAVRCQFYRASVYYSYCRQKYAEVVGWEGEKKEVGREGDRRMWWEEEEEEEEYQGTAGDHNSC